MLVTSAGSSVSSGSVSQGKFTEETATGITKITAGPSASLVGVVPSQLGLSSVPGETPNHVPYTQGAAFNNEVAALTVSIDPGQDLVSTTRPGTTSNTASVCPLCTYHTPSIGYYMSHTVRTSVAASSTGGSLGVQSRTVGGRASVPTTASLLVHRQLIPKKAIGIDGAVSGYPGGTGHVAVGQAGKSPKGGKLIEESNPFQCSTPSCDIIALTLTMTTASPTTAIGAVAVQGSSGEDLMQPLHSNESSNAGIEIQINRAARVPIVGRLPVGGAHTASLGACSTAGETAFVPKGTVEKSAFGVAFVTDRFAVHFHVFNVATTGPSILPAVGTAGSSTSIVADVNSVFAVSTSFGAALYPPRGVIVGAPGNVEGGRKGRTVGVPAYGSSTIPSLVTRTLAPMSSGPILVMPLDVDPLRSGTSPGNSVQVAQGTFSSATRTSPPVVLTAHNPAVLKYEAVVEQYPSWRALSVDCPSSKSQPDLNPRYSIDRGVGVVVSVL